jgi:hypothetical protein
MTGGTLTDAEVAKRLGGELSGGEILCPGPYHSEADRSLSVKFDDTAPDGFVVHSFAGDDPIACRDHVRKKLRLPAFEPRKKNGGSAAWTLISEHTYRDENNAPYLRVRRYLDIRVRSNTPNRVGTAPSGLTASPRRRRFLIGCPSFSPRRAPPPSLWRRVKNARTCW